MAHELYLIRHGDAVHESENLERPLSTLGQEQAGKIARYLKRNNILPDEIWHSEKLRARETAYIAARELSFSEKVFQKKGFNPDDNPLLAEETIEEFFLTRKKTLLIVSHLPLIPELSALLMVRRFARTSLRVPCAACLCFSREDSGPWLLKGLVEPSTLSDG